MPRLKKSPKEQLEANITANIRYYQEYYGYSVADLYRIAGFKASTWTSRRKKPSDFKVCELQRLASNFRIPITDLFKGRKDDES